MGKLNVRPPVSKAKENGFTALWALESPYLLRVYGVSDEEFDDLVDEDTKAELFDGVMIVHSPAAYEHDDVGGFVRGLMDFYADARGLGKVLGPDSLIRIAKRRRFGPDAYFLRRTQVPPRGTKEFKGVPDLVVEVLSPSNRGYDLKEKRQAYRAAGVREIWFIDAENRQVLIDRKRGGKYTEQAVTAGKLTSQVLKGFWIDADWLWAEPLPGKMASLHQILAAAGESL
jgi:Uma2 family endonuclease